MNYTQNYFDFMESRQNKVHSKNDGVYYELHHILPKSIYPEYSKLPGNLVLLTPKEHFIAHFLLTKIFTGENKYKMLCAFMRFCNGNAPNLKFASSRLYELKRKEWIEEHSKKMKGFKHSEETKLKISKSEKGKSVSEYTKQKLRESAKVQFESEEMKLKTS